MPRNRVNLDELSVLLQLCAIPRRKNNWLTLRHGDAQLAEALVKQDLAAKETLASEPAYQATVRGREVAAAMFGAAHKELFGEGMGYRA